MTLAERVAQAKREILEDMAAGRVPRSVKSFSELHSFVDANEYGSLNASPPLLPGGDVDVQSANDMQTEVGRWLATRRDTPLREGLRVRHLGPAMFFAAGRYTSAPEGVVEKVWNPTLSASSKLRPPVALVRFKADGLEAERMIFQSEEGHGWEALPDEAPSPVRCVHGVLGPCDFCVMERQ